MENFVIVLLIDKTLDFMGVRDTFMGVRRAFMKKLCGAVGVLFLFLLVTSCQQVFTYSPLSWAQRDPSTLPEAQKIAYAKEALASGDTAAVTAAYNALKGSTDPDTQALASQLAVSASGINDAIADVLATQTFDAGTVAAISGSWLTNAVTAMDAADAGNADITSEEYLTVAAAIIVLDAQANGNDISAVNVSGATPDKNGSSVDKALYYAVQAGYTQSDLEGMFSF